MDEKEKKLGKDFQKNMDYLNKTLAVNVNFDIVYRVIHIGGRNAVMYLIDGFCKDEMMQKMLQYFITLKPEDMPQDAHGMSKKCMPTVEVDLEDDMEQIIQNLLSGVLILLIDGYDKALMIDARTYPSRSVQEPEKDKVLRGSKDGFVETIVFNTALIRRRIRSENLRMEMMNAGKSSKTDIALCYMDNRADKKFLQQIKDRINALEVDALTLNQESLAECLYTSKWYNPFPKFKYTERPDTAAAQILEGNIIILVDNSPSAMILPNSIFDMVEEADDYYFPPITGSYLRITRIIIAFLTYIAAVFSAFMLTPSRQS